FNSTKKEKIPLKKSQNRKIYVRNMRYKNPEKSLHLKADSMYRYGEDRIVFLKMDSSRTY
ncbi:hypothetical protein NQV16_16930, partial [Weizmannia coagulans]|uniref:hypothetical protein n=1 Tax=Heyndrickxia coagulans TaxID=1398 RepID=UPI001E2BE835